MDRPGLPSPHRAPCGRRGLVPFRHDADAAAGLPLLERDALLPESHLSSALRRRRPPRRRRDGLGSAYRARLRRPPVPRVARPCGRGHARTAARSAAGCRSRRDVTLASDAGEVGVRARPHVGGRDGRRGGGLESVAALFARVGDRVRSALRARSVGIRLGTPRARAAGDRLRRGLGLGTSRRAPPGVRRASRGSRRHRAARAHVRAAAGATDGARPGSLDPLPARKRSRAGVFRERPRLRGSFLRARGCHPPARRPGPPDRPGGRGGAPRGRRRGRRRAGRCRTPLSPHHRGLPGGRTSFARHGKRERKPNLDGRPLRSHARGARSRRARGVAARARSARRGRRPSRHSSS